MPSYDLRAHLLALEKKDLLIRVHRPINKDTQLMPLVRWQFRGLREELRKAFFFENVVDVKGNAYHIPVAVGIHASSRKIYAVAMNCLEAEITDKWARVLLEPLPPVTVRDGPAQEVAYTADENNGLGQFPVPISTPGFDPAPFLTAPCWVTKDPETGVRNVGTYRAQIKSGTRTGLFSGSTQHIAVQWKKAKNLGKPLEAAIVIGGPPSVGLVSVTKVPYGQDEFAIAGAIAGEPIRLVKCRTVDLEVPADAEIILEGIIPIDFLESEAPFGEYSGYMGSRNLSPVFQVKHITRRNEPIYHAFISQFPPSESSKIRQIGMEGALFKFLKYDCNIPGVSEVALHEPSGSHTCCVIKMRKWKNSHAWQALNCAVGFNPLLGKIFVVVDDDIDARNLDSVMWAMSFRMQPHMDIRITQGKDATLDPSALAPGSRRDSLWEEERRGTSAVLIDGTRKWPYPPVSLPGRTFMEEAKEIWEELGLPHLDPVAPWHGYSLGHWTKENEGEAELALRGEHYLTGEKLAGRRESPGPVD